MKKNQNDDKMKKGIRLPLLVRISILVLLALFLAGIIVAWVSRNYRLKRAVEQGGGSARQACAIVRNYLAANDYGKEYFQDPASDPHSFYYLKESFFPEICTAMELRYLYLFTVDEKEVRHHIVSVALDAVDQEILDRELSLQVNSSDIPLRGNERIVLSGLQESALEEVDNEYGHVVNCIMAYYDVDGNLLALIGADCDMDYVMGLISWVF